MLYSWQTWNFQQWGVMTRTAIPIDQAKFLAANFLNARSSRKRRTPRRLLILSALWLHCPVALSLETVTYVYTDPQGTVLAEADAQGNITARFDYTPYGRAALSAVPDGPGYTGHVNDADTGLVYMQARYYYPDVGRFLSVDAASPAEGNFFNFNRYAYANNEPIAKFDPNGWATEIAMMYHVTNTGFGYAYGHEFVTMRDTNSKAVYITRAGPSGTYPLSNAVFNLKADQNGILPLAGQHSMTLVASVNLLSKSVEAPYENSYIPGSQVVLDRDFNDVLNEIKSIADFVNVQDIPYQPRTANSNAYANTVYKSLTGKDAPYQDRFKGSKTHIPIKPPVPPRSEPPCISGSSSSCGGKS